MLRIGLLLVVATYIAACATPPPPTEPVPEEPAAVVVEPATPATPPREKTPPARVPQPPPLPSVAIVLTNKQPAYADVAAELTKHFGNYTVYDLSDASRPPVSVLRMINDSGPAAVVAIGVRAAQSSVAMSQPPVVFSQVFNYEHYGLLNGNSRGVAMLPPLDAQLAAWKDLDPTIRRIGFIIGEGHEDLISEAEIAAQRHGLELVVNVTHSDQETLYVFRRMIRDIDGFLLLPDNRVLSARVLQEMLADAGRHRVPVSVPSDSMLSLGATLSMTASAADIAATIVKVVRAIQAGDLDRVPPISALSEIRVTTSPAERVARQ